jgi:hypothetical protein
MHVPPIATEKLGELAFRLVGAQPEVGRDCWMKRIDSILEC